MLFLRTGDLGRVVKKHLFICGRIKDLIIVGGKNYYPQDFEHAATEASSMVRPGCIASFELMHDNGQAGVALVFESRDDKNLEGEEELEKISRVVLAECGLKPCAVVAVKRGTIPKTTSGKIKRHETKTFFLEKRLCVQASIIDNVYTTSHGPAEFPAVKPLLRRWYYEGDQATRSFKELRKRFKVCMSMEEWMD